MIRLGMGMFPAQLIIGLQIKTSKKEKK